MTKLIEKNIAENYIANKVGKEFYLQNTVITAQQLLGKTLVRITENGIMAAIISETEAYLQENDFASHSFNGPTKRNSAMFLEGGTLYVYKIYGIHYCMNAVTETEGIGAAVLLRGALPIEGVGLMMQNRNSSNIKNLCKGPGNLSKAFGVDLSFNSVSLLKDEIFISEYQSFKNNEFLTTKRIGISKSQDLELRFCLKIQ